MLSGAVPRLRGMTRSNRTYRDVDGRRVEGTWRHVFINNGGTYYLTDLKVYADGLIDCWGLVDLDGFRQKLTSGWVATTLPDGGRASGHLLASWTFNSPAFTPTIDDLYGEVADEIERLAGRPTTSDLCVEAAHRYVETRTEEDRLRLVDAYLKIPETHRTFVLGDMDHRDWPVRALATPPGSRPIGGRGDDAEDPITEADRGTAFDYFAQQAASRSAWIAKSHDDGPAGGDPGSIRIEQRWFPNGWPAQAGILVLRNEYPAALEVDGDSYPSVAHAYWARSVRDGADHDLIRAEPYAGKARHMALDFDRRPGWSGRRLAVMAELLDTKFRQHPDLAAALLATGEKALLYQEAQDSFWGCDGGRNSMGRLLELIRSQLLPQA